MFLVVGIVRSAVAGGRNCLANLFDASFPILGLDALASRRPAGPGRLCLLTLVVELRLLKYPLFGIQTPANNKRHQRIPSDQQFLVG